MLCLASNSAFAGNPSSGILSDTTSSGHIKIHHSFEAGIICELGKQYVRTYNSYEHTTSPTNNYLINQYDRFLSLRFEHSVVLKNIVSTGMTYGLDFYAQPHQDNFFVPLLWHVAYFKPVAKRLGLAFKERAGYAFYLHNKIDNPILQYFGVAGGFTSETTVGLGILAKHKNWFTVNAGYRLQHTATKSFFYPGQTLTQAGGVYATLPAKIT